MPKVFEQEVDGRQVVTIPLFALIEPGATGSVEITFNNGCANGNPGATVHVGAPLAENNDECYAKLLETSLDFLPGGDCVKLFRGFIVKEGTSLLIANKPASATSVVASAALNALKCAGDLVPPVAIIKKVIKAVDTLSKLNKTAGVLAYCTGVIFPNNGTSVGGGSGSTQCIASRDPNQIVGPDGAGEARYVSGEVPFLYTIYFENKPDATAAAQDVVITNQLDTAKFDISTFQLGDIGFADKLVHGSARLERVHNRR
jgi:hypothetical protein